VEDALHFFNTRQRHFVLRRTGADRRRLVAELYLSGEGLEIGALNSPLTLPAGARVRYVDRLGPAELSQHYPDLHVVQVDVIDDAECLTSVPLASQDFIVANHVLEHCQDPIRALETMAARVKPAGVLYLAVPDADQTFDARRPSTSFDHLLADRASGPARSRHAHYVEWVSAVESLDGAMAATRVNELEDMAYSIHFHVWRFQDLLQFFTRVIDECGLPLTTELIMRHGIEVICVVRRQPDI
jgi:SAM-dependent methyltransferase